MKFDFCIGNPPYQETISQSESQSQSNTTWVYHRIAEVADNISDTSCLIYPFGGWFDEQEALDGFGKRLLTDGHTVAIDAYEGTSDKRAWYRTDKDPEPIFKDNANLSAGVAVVLRDNCDTHDTYEYMNRMYSDDTVIVSVSDAPYLTPNPAFLRINKKLTGAKLSSSIKKCMFGIDSGFVESNPTKVSDKKSDWAKPVRLLTNDKSGPAGRATLYWTDKDNIPRGHDYLPYYKVVITSAYPKKSITGGNPTITNVKDRMSQLVDVLPKDSAFGSSRMLLFSSTNKAECDNFIKYTQTNFFAGLMLQEPNRRSTFGSVIPLQDFTAQSDIDWTKSVEEIDVQLYAKYNMTQADIKFIEATLAEGE